MDPGRIDKENIYRHKFNAFYGKRLAESVESGSARVTPETLFPVLLTTVVVSVGWVAIFWRGLDRLENPTLQVDMMQFAFLGAYLFVLQMLIRRFFQSDLRSGAYAHALVRILAAVLLVPVVHQLLLATGGSAVARWEPLVVFAVGAFPLIGIEAIVQAASRPLRLAVPSLRPTYPLSQLDGLNVWYEARLVEEGIEDMQNLATANLVDVMLHTRVPVGRLVEWVNQAYLAIHLPPASGGWLSEKLERRARRKARERAAEVPSRHLRDVLRTAGVTTATDLVRAVPLDADGNARAGRASRLAQYVADQAGVDRSAVETLALVLREHSGLNPVRSWLAGAARVARPQVHAERYHAELPDARRPNGSGNGRNGTPAATFPAGQSG
jgi:hypothetical protein